MTRTEVREFIKAGVEALNEGLEFGSGRISEWNSSLQLGTWWESIQPHNVTIVNNTLPHDEWPVTIWIGKKDTQDSLPAQYEEIIDACDFIAQRLIYKYNQVVENSKTSTLTGISREPFVKKNAVLTSGVKLTFTLNAPDKTKVC